MTNLLAQAQELNLNQIQSNALPGFKFSGGTIGSIISAALPYVFFVAGIALLIFFIFAGYRLMFSAGDPKAMADAKAKMTYAIIGFIIVFMAYWIVQIVASFLGLSDITNTFTGGGTPGRPF